MSGGSELTAELKAADPDWQKISKIMADQGSDPFQGAHLFVPLFIKLDKHPSWVTHSEDCPWPTVVRPRALEEREQQEAATA